MNKKQKKEKNLQKQLCTIVEMYKEQKGKEKRKLLADFIQEKLGEILLFRDVLSVKEMKQKEAFVNDDLTRSQVIALQPSSALVNELHKSAIISQQFSDAGTVQ